MATDYATLGRSVSEVRAAIQDAARTAGVGQAAPGVGEELAGAISEYVSALVAGEFEDYRQFVASRGGGFGADGADGPGIERHRSFFDSATEPYRGSAIGLGGVVVRPVVRNGSNVPRSDTLGAMSFVTSDERFPQLGGVAVSTEYGHVVTGDTYEVLVPTIHRFRGVETVVYTGLWLTKSPDSDRWLPSRVMVYVPSGASGTPIIPPPL